MGDAEDIPTQKDKSSRVADFIADPRRAVWKLSVPLMLGMTLHTLYSVTDMIFVGMLGGDAVAALTFNMPIVFFGIGITFGLGTGATAVIARFLGEGDKESADSAAEHALLLALGVGTVIIVVGLSAKHEIIALLGATDAVSDLAIEYFQILVPGFLFTTLNVSFRSIMTGEGDTRTPIMFAAIGTILNAFLDPLLIFWAGLGISGAAWATVVSHFISKYGSASMNRSSSSS